MFLGFAAGYKGVVCYNTGNNKLIISRHMIHDESVFPYKLQGLTVIGNTSKAQFTRISPVIIQVSNSVTNSHVGLSQSREQQTTDPETVEEGLRHNTHESSSLVQDILDIIHEATNSSSSYHSLVST